MNELEPLKIDVTMDSREIAEVIGKRHDHVVRDIEQQLGQLEGGVLRFGDTYRNEQNGQEYKCYKLPAREVLILVSGYNVQLRAKIIDRLNQLEREKALGDFQIPKDYASALRLAADQQEKLDAQQKQIEADKPKVDFYKAVTGSKDTIDIGSVAKVLAVPRYGRNNLFDALRRHGVLMDNNQPYQKFIDAGCFRVVEGSYRKSDGSTHVTLQTLVYQKGVELCRRVVEKDRSGGAA